MNQNNKIAGYFGLFTHFYLAPEFVWCPELVGSQPVDFYKIKKSHLKVNSRCQGCGMSLGK